MNTHTAAVIDFQAPRHLKKNVSYYERNRVDIHFKTRISADKGAALSRELSNHLAGVYLHRDKSDELGMASEEGRTHWICSDNHSYEAVGLIEGLFLYGAITMTERSRLLGLFSKQLGFLKHTKDLQAA